MRNLHNGVTHSTNLHSDDPGLWGLLESLLALPVFFALVFALPVVCLVSLLRHLYLTK